MEGQSSDWESKRLEGEYWEQKCAELLCSFGYVVVRNQERRSGAATAMFKAGGQLRRVPTPDLMVSGPSGASHWEVKHKKPTNHRQSFGIEKRQFDALLEFRARSHQPVYIAIHDHQNAGGKHVRENRLRDWVYAEVGQLDPRRAWKSLTTQRNGEPIVIYYWPRSTFRPLVNFMFLSGAPADPEPEQAAVCF